MSKIPTVLFALCLAASSGIGFAQDSMAMDKDTMSKDAMGKNETPKNSTGKKHSRLHRPKHKNPTGQDSMKMNPATGKSQAM